MISKVQHSSSVDQAGLADSITLAARGAIITCREQQTPAQFYLYDPYDPHDFPMFPRLVYVTGHDFLEIVGDRSKVIVALAEIRFRCQVAGYIGRGSDATLLLVAASFFRGIARELERDLTRPTAHKV